MKILITGDSFAADYTKKYKDKCGWPNLLDGVQFPGSEPVYRKVATKFNI
jgi:hypothetical protein